jgi:hypothetical protein
MPVSFISITQPGWHISADCLQLAPEAAAESEQPPPSPLPPRCRTRDAILPPHLFSLHTCALCYIYMMPGAFSTQPARPAPYHQGEHHLLKLIVNSSEESVSVDKLTLE